MKAHWPAAPACGPHIGFGVSKAGAKTQALAEALRDHDDIDRALAACNAVRQPLGACIVPHGPMLGTQLCVDLETDEDHRMSKLLQSAKGYSGSDCSTQWLRRPKTDSIHHRCIRLIMSVPGASRPWRDVRLESEMRTKTDIDQSLLVEHDL